MKVSSQLMRIIKEEIESIDYGKVTVTVNSSGAYAEIATEKRIRLVKTPEEISGVTDH